MSYHIFTPEETKSIWEHLWIDRSRFDVQQFRLWMNTELEHGTCDTSTDVTWDDAIMTGKIALAHLKEFPDYYTRLEKMEKEAEAYREKK